ncbi:TetR/AcrR family transcriptional regulator [Phyllobacterium sp. TAF24]|uniref:TetR/AcrR family transcriptional regulator n=1 Tax=Phyllobacterium sp. TAF24 TaxID=3233068 RepID=UPI003F9B27A7
MAKPANTTIPMHQRDAGETRGRILQAAKLHFSRQGYDHVGVREIAGDAGVNAALVNRYFGSKEELFAEVAASAFDINDIAQGPINGWGEHTARFLAGPFNRDAEVLQFDPFQFLLLSALSPVAAPIVARHLHANFVVALADRIEAANAELRATLVTSYIIGFALSRVVLKLPGLGDEDIEKAVRFLGASIQSCLTGPIPGRA